jgi:non-lysosomal glucosylceramidase
MAARDRKAAWVQPLGTPPTHPGQSKVTHETIIDDGPWGGVPLGGMGSGSIGRTPRGDFARWHLTPGVHHFETVPACQLSLYTEADGVASAHVLSTVQPDALPTWGWGLPAGAGTYRARFPQAWHEIDWDALPVRVTQHQFSPVIPGTEREASLPVGVIEVTLENPGALPVRAGLMLTWQNLAGHWDGHDELGGHHNIAMRSADAVGVVLEPPADAAGESWAGAFAIAAATGPGVSVSTRSRFDVADGSDLWGDFAADGALDDVNDPAPSIAGERIGAGVAATVDVPPGSTRTVAFTLAWDFPVVEFGDGRRWHPLYTRWYGRDGLAAWRIATDALRERDVWLAAIDAWQAPVLASPDRPDWYKAALFNELYYLVDGGTLWGDPAVSADQQDAVPEPGRFALLECFDYPFYNTLDVYFYASAALVRLWPNLAREVVRDFVRSVPADDPEVVPVWATGGTAIRKVPGALPHDIGGPTEDPFVRLNTYHLQDPNLWKDLNTKFVLLVWQLVYGLGDEQLARDTWPAVRMAMQRLAATDRDGDGLPEHDGVPDQTYDTWPMSGPSAYGGSLWLAAAAAAQRMAGMAGDFDTAAWLDDIRSRAEVSFEARLWAGTHYRYDGGGGTSSDSIMSDQLVGQWFADATGLGDLVPAERVLAGLQTVFERNVLGFLDGTAGAVNGTRPDGSVDRSGEQSQEVWTGTTYALAAFMAGRGMTDEAWQTARGVDATIEARGYRFRTPEAWDDAGNFRASMYLRPLAIWAIEHALTGREE